MKPSIAHSFTHSSPTHPPIHPSTTLQIKNPPTLQPMVNSIFKMIYRTRRGILTHTSSMHVNMCTCVCTCVHTHVYKCASAIMCNHTPYILNPNSLTHARTHSRTHTRVRWHACVALQVYTYHVWCHTWYVYTCRVLYAHTILEDVNLYILFMCMLHLHIFVFQE
jgi:hypothetical protein